jgi:hypothetical protein
VCGPASELWCVLGHSFGGGGDAKFGGERAKNEDKSHKIK